MVNLYPAYKPFRNYMRQFDLVASLLQLWGYYLHVAEGRALHPQLAAGAPPHLCIADHLYPWDLEILVREVVLNAERRGSDELHTWSKLAKAVNYIRDLEGTPYGNGPDRADIMVDLQRIAHRQFRWQSESAKLTAQIVRALKIFGGRELDTKVQEKFGMHMRRALQLGMAAGGSLLNRPVLHLGTDYSAISVPGHVSRSFLERLVCTPSTLRERTRGLQQYNDAWLYASFPLEHTPLIRFDPAQPDLVICPIPRYLLNRVSSGVFYDIVNINGFANAYGNAFQRYIGEVIQKTLPPHAFQVLEETPYSPRKATRKHGADWVVSDRTGHLFIECKTKRLSLGAKNVTDQAALSKDMAAMTQAIIQNYKNIRDALDGKTSWQPDGGPIYPLIVTLEDWHLFSTHLTHRLYKEVREALMETDINIRIVDELPYTIASASELEVTLQVVAATSIDNIFSLKTSEEFRHWGWIGFLPTKFAAEHARTIPLLFPEDAQQLLES